MSVDTNIKPTCYLRDYHTALAAPWDRRFAPGVDHCARVVPGRYPPGWIQWSITDQEEMFYIKWYFIGSWWQTIRRQSWFSATMCLPTEVCAFRKLFWRILWQIIHFETAVYTQFLQFRFVQCQSKPPCIKLSFGKMNFSNRNIQIFLYTSLYSTWNTSSPSGYGAA